MAGTASTSETDRRSDSLDRFPVWEQVITFTFASGDTAEVKEAVPINGILQKVVVECGACSGAVVTATVAIDDNRDVELFSVDTLAESTDYVYGVYEPLTGKIDVGVTPSTDPLSAYIVVVTLRGV